MLAITPFDAILDRALRNDRGKSTDGEELISKQQSIRCRNEHYIVSQEPVKDKLPSAVAVLGGNQARASSGPESISNSKPARSVPCTGAA